MKKRNKTEKTKKTKTKTKTTTLTRIEDVKGEMAQDDRCRAQDDLRESDPKEWKARVRSRRTDEKRKEKDKQKFQRITSSDIPPPLAKNNFTIQVEGLKQAMREKENWQQKIVVPMIRLAISCLWLDQRSSSLKSFTLLSCLVLLLDFFSHTHTKREVCWRSYRAGSGAWSCESSNRRTWTVWDGSQPEVRIQIGGFEYWRPSLRW